VSTFDESEPDSINIHYTTIQGLHSRMQNPKENAVTVEDFKDRQIVLISDEAHHLNAETVKNPGQGELELIANWEGTVRRILNADPGNAMLEFTATVNLGHPAIADKYRDKILYDYSLRQFREDGYSKDVILRQADLPPAHRMMQAMILSQYRRRIAEANGIALKPVILMKSRQIAESKANEEVFHALVDAVDGDALLALRAASTADASMKQAFEYVFDQSGADPADFARELRRDFAPPKIVNVNDNKELEARQIALNSLEDRDNEIRVIFAVDKLNEGWDVLNLFDIVRLYDAQTNATSTAEKQLIGRGARYFPFEMASLSEAPREKRKLDEDVAHPLRVLEELYYHCSHNPQYIAHIREVLATAGIVAENEKPVTLKLKDSFRQSDFFKNEVVMANERKPNTRKAMTSLAAYSAETALKYPVLMTGHVIDGGAFGADDSAAGGGETVPHTFALPELGMNVLRHALDSMPFYRFDSLRHHFPQLSGIRAFMESEQYLGGLKIEVRGTKAVLEALGARDKLKIAQYALGAVEAAVRRNSVDWKGSKEFKPTAISALFGEDKQIKVSGENAKGWKESQYLHGVDLGAKDWHVFEDSFGTSEEKLFIRWVNDRADALKEQFSEFYLIRNERVVRLYTFDTGEALEPDFLMFLRTRDDGKKLIYQLFIEPKGQHLLEHDKWKEDFLKGLHAQAVVTLFQGKDYRVFGLPFFNDGDAAQKQAFETAFDGITAP
jgi:type III restriction enzyme